MALVFLAGVLWSTVGLGVRFIEDAQVWQILFFRSISLSIFLSLIIYLMRRENPLVLASRMGMNGVLGALSLIAAYAGGIYSIQATSVGNAMLLFASAPFMAAILGQLVLGEKVRKATWLAIVVAMIGIAIMVADKFGGQAIYGNLAAIGSAFGFAVFTITLRRGKTTDMMPVVFLSGLFGIVIMAGICLNGSLSFFVSLNDIGISLSMGIFQVGAGLVLYTLGSRTVPAAELTLLALAEVVLGPFWVWLFLGEILTLHTIVGGAVLLVAIAGNALSGQRRKPPIHGA
jgi:drug/metabolite transporter (DMT)-like permease|tara:strand:- start:156 stop:1019 length:864 start_codon:yes stop_codon:yes gene_type:complete